MTDKPKRTRRVIGLVALIGVGVAIWVAFRYLVADPRLFLEYLRVLVWPVTVAAVLFWLRAPLREKFTDLMRVEAFGATAHFKDGAAAASLDQKIKEPAEELLAQNKRPDARENLDEVVRRSALWGYELGHQRSASTPDSRRLAATPREQQGADRVSTESGRLERNIADLEDEIKAIERKRHNGVIGLGESAADYLWLNELRRRLERIDPGNTWARG